MLISVITVTLQSDSPHPESTPTTWNSRSFVAMHSHLTYAQSAVIEITAHSLSTFIHSFVSEPEVLIPGD